MVKINRLVDGSSGISPFGPSDKVKAAIRKAVKNINTAPTVEMEQLKKLYHSKFGIASENLLFANSLNELIFFVIASLNPEKVLVPGPAPVLYEEAARSAGAEVFGISPSVTDEIVFDTSRMRDSISETNPVLLSSPNRITGKIFPLKEIREIVMELGNKSPHFIIDGALMQFTGELKVCQDLVQTGKITFLGTTALFYGIPGLELAFAVSSPEMIDLYSKKKHWDINLLSLEAARTAYKDSSYVRKLNKFVITEKKLITRMLGKIDGISVYDSETNVFLVKIPDNPEETVRKFKSAGLDIRNCAGINGLDSSFYSIALMKHEDNLKMISALKK
jgi:histidinol-phosphate/aromatic aminotransferase/cobyric acid decarboxylase-like protein